MPRPGWWGSLLPLPKSLNCSFPHWGYFQTEWGYCSSLSHFINISHLDIHRTAVSSCDINNVIATPRQQVTEVNQVQRSCCPLCFPLFPCTPSPDSSRAHAQIPSPFELKSKVFCKSIQINSYLNLSLYRRLKLKRKWDVRLAMVSI